MDNAQNNNQNYKKDPGTYSNKTIIIVVALIIIFAIVAITIGIVSDYKPSNTNGSNNGNTPGTITPIKKQAPSVSVEQSLDGLIFNIQCNDDYDFVLLFVQLFDKDYNAIKTFTLRENNMKIGELRQAEYKFSLGEMFNSSHVKASIASYE